MTTHQFSEPPGSALEPACTVSGRVHAFDHTAMGGVLVIAWDQELRSRRELGRTRTGRDGSFLITYAPADPLIDSSGADVVLEVASDDRVLHSSQTYFNAPRALVVTLTLDAVASGTEIERIARSIAPLTAAAGIRFDALEESAAHRDLSFLNGETGWSREQLLTFALAHRLATQQGIAAEFWYALQHAHLARTEVGQVDRGENLDAAVAGALRSALAAGDDAAGAAIDEAANARIIAAVAPETKTAWLTAFAALKQGRGPELRPPFALDHTDGDPPHFVAGAGEEERRRNYAELRRLMGHENPTAAMHARLRQLGTRTLAALNRSGAEMADALGADPVFDLRSASVNAMLSRSNGRSGSADPTLEQDLKAVQRVFKAAASVEGTAALLADGVHSARQIYRMGKESFVARYSAAPGIGADAAAVWERAAGAHAAALVLSTEMRATLRSRQVFGLRGSDDPSSDFPDVARLFGTTDFCSCESCRSIFSPAAYLTDLLEFLGDRRVGDGRSARDVLFLRRPDIGFIDLTCENATTQLPYIDLACEILEGHVAPATLGTLPVAVTSSLVPGPVAAPVRDAFRALRPSLVLSPEAVVSPSIAVPPSWVIRDGVLAYRVLQTATGLEVSVPPQTRGSAEDLAASPEHTNDAAYAILATATTGMSLPFDLHGSEVRAYLAKAGVTRAEIMGALRGPEGATRVSDAAIAGERLGLSPAEQRLVFKADLANQFKYWRASSAAALVDEIGRVDVFLDRAGLDYAGLERLLGLRFINPVGAVRIEQVPGPPAPADPCDTAQKRLSGITAEWLDRVHRFLRLQRALGGDPWDVDLIVMNQGIGKGRIDEAFAGALHAWLMLRERLPALSVEQLAAFFDDINTVRKTVGGDHPPLPSLYEQLFLSRRMKSPSDSDYAVDAVRANAPAAPRIADRMPQVVGATKLKPSDVMILLQLPGRTRIPANDRVGLRNLSFLHRHALLARTLGFKIPEWAMLLHVAQLEPFATPGHTVALLDLVERIKSAGLTVDELGYVLAADPTAKAAVSERSVQAVLSALRTELRAIIDNAPAVPRSTDDRIALINAQLLALGWPADAAARAVSALTATARVPSFPADLPFPTASLAAIPISVDHETRVVSFAGIMTRPQKAALLSDPALGPLTQDPDYRRAIDGLFEAPRAALKFYWPEFRAAMPALPPDVRFTSLPDAALSGRIRYDAERRELVCFGVMTAAEHDALARLSEDPAYHAALQQLQRSPGTVTDPAEIWVTDDRDLTSAIAGLIDYVVQERLRAAAIQALAVSLTMTPAVAELLATTLTSDERADSPLLAEFTTRAFGSSSAALTAAAFPGLFSGYTRLHRTVLVLRKTKATYGEIAWLTANRARVGVLDWSTLPRAWRTDPPAVAPIARLLDLVHWVRLAHGWDQHDLQLFSLVGGLSPDRALPVETFAEPVEALTGWPRSDVASSLIALHGSSYAQAMLTADGWERLRRAMTLVERLGTSAASLTPLTAAGVGAAEAAAVKQMLRSGRGDDEWRELNRAVQDGLRESKRTALSAWLLARGPESPDTPRRWRTAADLFAHFLIDVEMCACQSTSRIVQAAAAVQLFVQRAFLGLEPEVRVNVDEQPEWKQWSWMERYRIWEANRKVFAHAGDYAEVELRRDKSEIFAAFETELQQGDVTRDAVDTAFLNYLERLDAVAQLEIAGTFFEDETSTLHVFGRTAGREPHTYYYRRQVFDRWSAWSKVDCDIQSDYLVPFVANHRLHLVWPEFREQPDEQGPATVPTQGREGGQPMDKPKKKMAVHLAITELRNGKWLPRKVSEQPVEVHLQYSDSFDRSTYVILPIDLTSFAAGAFFLLIYDTQREVWKLFVLAGCRGYPEPFDRPLPLKPVLTRFDRDRLVNNKNVETTDGDPLVPRNNVVLHEKILNLTPGSFRIAYPHHLSIIDQKLLEAIQSELDRMFGKTAAERAAPGPDRPISTSLGAFNPWFYADKLRTFFVQPLLVSVHAPRGSKDLTPLLAALDLVTTDQRQAFLREAQVPPAAPRSQLVLRFSTFYHPHVCHFLETVSGLGIPGLLTRDMQSRRTPFDFAATFQPEAIVDAMAYPKEDVDFSRTGSYSLYNWELFFFAPLLIATRLSRNQKFAEAREWLHYIFNPTGGYSTDPVTGAPAGSPQKYWITRPFYDLQAKDYLQQRFDRLSRLLAGDAATPEELEALHGQVAEWRRNPFDPHLIAESRLVEYQKLTVMKYLDNLIAWGDQLFRQMDSVETLNSATQLYILAQEILGPRPRRVSQSTAQVRSYNELAPTLDDFSNALVELENQLPAPPAPPRSGPEPPLLPTLYFCVPESEKLLRYWDTVDDRLYKIRHCLDISGAARSLPLFSPPIDPADLVRAAASGVDVAAALADLHAPLPHYRFTAVVQKAKELLLGVASLGAGLLAALEKRDAETMALLRQQHEASLLAVSRSLRQTHIEEARLAIEGLAKNREMAVTRRDFYRDRAFISEGEQAALTLSETSLAIHTAGTVADVLGGVLALVPDFNLGASGFGGSPHATAKTGGLSFSKASELAARAQYQTAAILDKTAGMTATLAAFQRRMDDWTLQREIAEKEIEQLDRQIASATQRLAAAEQELVLHDRQVRNASEVTSLLQNKYSNRDLYDWLTTQLSQTYFQTYNQAYDLARRAERCLQYELGTTASYVQFGQWDSLRSGLHAGERLQASIALLEAAYLDGHAREFECTKHVSLALVDPRALLQLRATGSCVVQLPEELFDLDFPGHYFRRIKAVSVSIPGVVGPYTGVPATLRLLKNSVRISTELRPQYAHNSDNGMAIDDARFRESQVRVKAIATSSGQNDSGVFELDFRDERYLPFEGAGVIGTWQLELAGDQALRQFDYDTIADVILHVHYRSREELGEFKAQAAAHVKQVLETASGQLRLRRLLDLTREFPTEWQAFVRASSGPTPALSLPLAPHHFPFLAQNRDIRVERLTLAVETRTNRPLVVRIEPLLADPIVLPRRTGSSSLQAASSAPDVGHTLARGGGWEPWRFQIRYQDGDAETIAEEDVTQCSLLIEYTLA